jgi:glucose/arabinose dehydrogenase
VTAYARALDHPRWLCVLPNGDVLVAETNGPARPDDNTGIKGWFTKRVMKRAGAGVPSANRISLLRDADGDGVAETRTVFLRGLDSPFGMALVDGTLYVANTDALVCFPYRDGQTQITEPGIKVADLPGGTINHHWTKNVIASRDGSRLYVTVGSNSNAAEHGIEAEVHRAAILEVDPATGKPHAERRMGRLAVVILDPVAELSQHGLGIPQLGAEDVVAFEGVDKRLGEPVALRRIRLRACPRARPDHNP